MEDPRLVERLLRYVSDTEAEEISCSECFELLSVGVELELAGATSAPGLTRLAKHLGQCGVCRAEYETLRDFVRSEAERVPPPPEGTSLALG
jgi:predicted anti-sigma-YlaC factor YlaD